MTDLYDWLRTLFTYEEDFHPVFAKSLDRLRDNKLPANVDREYEFKNHGLKFRIGLVLHEKNFTRLIIYVPDRKIITDSEKLINRFNILDCNYILYGLYLNIAAYLIGADRYNLNLILASDTNKNPTTFIYRPEIAEAILNWKAKSEKERASGSLADSKAAGQVGLF